MSSDRIVPGRNVKTTKHNRAAPRRATRRRGRNDALPRAMLALFCLVFALICAGGIFVGYDLGSSWMTVQAVLMSLFFAGVLFFSHQQTKTFYLLSSSYLLTFSVFHVSFTYLHALGVVNLEGLASSERGAWYELGGWYIFLAMTCFGLGTVLGRKIRPEAPLSQERQALCLADVYWVGLGLLLASALLFGSTLLQVGSIFKYSRAELFKGVGDTRGFGVFLMIFPTAALLLVLGAQTRAQYVLGFATALIGAIFIMFLGYRFNALAPILVGAILWTMIGRRIHPVLLLIGALCLLVVIPAVSYFRALGSYDQLTAEDFSKSLEKTTASDTFLELGSTGGIVAAIVHWIPEEAPYQYGKTYLFALESMLPNLSSELSKSQRIQDPDSKTAEELIDAMGPADWYIYRVNRWMYKNGGGGGFSAVAEAYMNLGFFGVVIVFMFVGYVFGRCDVTRLLENSWTLLLVAACIWPFFTGVRNEAGTFIKPISFTLIVILAWKLCTSWYAKSWRRKYINAGRRADARRALKEAKANAGNDAGGAPAAANVAQA